MWGRASLEPIPTYLDRSWVHHRNPQPLCANHGAAHIFRLYLAMEGLLNQRALINDTHTPGTSGRRLPFTTERLLPENAEVMTSNSTSHHHVHFFVKPSKSRWKFCPHIKVGAANHELNSRLLSWTTSSLWTGSFPYKFWLLASFFYNLMWSNFKIRYLSLLIITAKHSHPQVVTLRPLRCIHARKMPFDAQGLAYFA